MAITMIFFLVVVFSLILLLVARRVILGRFLRWRLNKVNEWGKILDRIIARMDEPSPAEVHDLSVVGPMTRSALEDALLSRMDLLAGNSRLPLIKVFQRSHLLNLCVGELDSRNVWKRRKAVDALGRAAGRHYATHLARALDDPDGTVRIIAARSLGKMGIQVAAPAMVAQFNKLEESECNVIVDALINMGSASLAPLTYALFSEAEKMRYFSALTVSHICEEGRCQLIVMRRMPRRRVTDVPVEFPRELPDRLLRLTWDESSRVRCAAVSALAKLQVSRAASRIEKMLAGDRDASVRSAAAAAMSLLARTESAQVMLEALEDEDWDVQYAAAKSIIELGAPWIDRLERPPYGSRRALAWRDEIRAAVKFWS